MRTKQRLREMHWLPRLDSEVEQAVRGCTICQTADKSAKTFAATILPVPLSSQPWQKLGIDIASPFQHTPLNCRFMINVVDYYSRWPEVGFAREVTTATVTSFL